MNDDLYQIEYCIILNMNLDDVDVLVKKALEKLKEIKGFEKVNFVILYGSTADGLIHEDSDIDLCVDVDAETDYEFSRFRLSILSELPDIFDVHVFEQLPLYVKKEVLKGKVIFCRDEDYLYETALLTVKEFDDLLKCFSLAVANISSYSFAVAAIMASGSSVL